jgi:hypothetical protein
MEAVVATDKAKSSTMPLARRLVAPEVAWPGPKGGRRPGRKQGHRSEIGAATKLNDVTSPNMYSGAFLESEEILELGVANADIH